ncbi:MAG: hypothetical protein DCC46_05370 [Armatimonadetes bacterium]|nr:MAG: hypothetical protein DCC46_05370 [Armatimonadota bacterium]
MRVVCFDLGGVLVSVRQDWLECIEAAGLADAARLRTSVHLTEFEGFDRFQAGEIAENEYLEGLAEFIGGIDSADALEVHNAILATEFRGVLEVVESLHSSQIVTGCLSNTNAPHWHLMHHTERFPAIRSLQFPIASHEIRQSKPEPRAYRTFEVGVQANPDEILYFEDGPANVEAAIRLGWDAVLIDPEDDPAKQMRLALAHRGALL